MPNLEDINDSIIDDFSPIASSSQQWNFEGSNGLNHNLNKDINQQENKSSNSQLPQISKLMSAPKLWSNYMHNSNENEPEITLTQLNDISNNSQWNSMHWIAASEEYKEEIKHNINFITRKAKSFVGDQGVPFLIAVIVRKENTTDLTAYNSITLTLRDRSGEIKAVIPKDIHSINAHLVPNSVVVLRNVRILPVLKSLFLKHYIMLNKNSIEAVFTENNQKICFLTNEEVDSCKLNYKNEINNHNLKEFLECVDNNFNVSVCETETLELTPKSNVTGINIQGENSKQTSFVMPDLGFDLDDDVGSELDFTSKKPKLQVNEEKNVMEVKKTNCDNEIVISTKPRKPFIFVKQNVKVQQPPENYIDSSQLQVRSQNPEDAEIVKEVFDGLDVSIFDDF